MTDVLLHLDRLLFAFCNQTLQNRLFDIVFPFLTDLNRKPLVLVAVGIIWVLMLWKGGPRGRVAGVLLVPTIAISDKLNSAFLKYLIERPRPCHELSNVHLLVGCGSGFSFPSSHAVNTFAGAILLSYFYPKWTWAFFTYALLVAFSRVYVGVHYPSDVLGGGILGLAIGGMVVTLYRLAEEWFIRRRAQGSAEVR